MENEWDKLKKRLGKYFPKAYRKDLVQGHRLSGKGFLPRKVKPMKLVTVVYEIENEEEWGKTNPLHYTHNGLKAVTVGIGDALEARDALRELMPFAREDYDYLGEACTPGFKNAIERALASLA